MKKSESSGTNPWPEYESGFREWESQEDEFERMEEEFERMLKAYDRLCAAFYEASRATDLDEFERKLKEYDRLSKEFYQASHSQRSPLPKPEKKYARQERAEEPKENESWWTVRIQTISIPKSYLKLMSVLKEIEDEIAREDEEYGLDFQNP